MVEKYPESKHFFPDRGFERFIIFIMYFWGETKDLLSIDLGSRDFSADRDEETTRRRRTYALLSIQIEMPSMRSTSQNHLTRTGMRNVNVVE